MIPNRGSLAHPALPTLAEHLARRSRLPDGVLRVAYPTDRFDLRTPAVEHVSSGGFSSSPLPFETLHQRVPVANQLWDGGQNAVDADDLVFRSPGFRAAYHRLVAYLAREILGYDVLFEEKARLRFHFPVDLPNRYRGRDGTLLAYHTDTLFSDPFEEFNVWLPLATCFGQNALHWVDLPDGIAAIDSFCADIGYDADLYVAEGRRLFYEKLVNDEPFQQWLLGRMRPLASAYGELILFDSRVVHGTVENTDDHTRVSIDFRLLPLQDFEDIRRRYAEAGLPLPIESASDLPLDRGGYYDRRTAFEL